MPRSSVGPAASTAPRVRPGLVAFDVDGTLVGSADGRVVWQLLNEAFGGDPAENRNRFAAYLEGRITYARWVDLDVGQWVAAGARRWQIEAEVRRGLHLLPGARETVLALHRRGYRLAVISGTLDLTLDLLFPDHPFEAVYTNRILFDEDGAISGWQATPYDMEGKAEALLELARSLDLPREATVFVGDHINDLGAMNAAGLAIAFEPKTPEVEQAAHHVLRGTLLGMLDLLP